MASVPRGTVGKGASPPKYVVGDASITVTQGLFFLYAFVHMVL